MNCEATQWVFAVAIPPSENKPFAPVAREMADSIH
jgi:hypothetical protein